ncbi:hypothetical protein [Streptomyces bikiniensis]|uniref:hypothetical protein n=1 Tax=Streptomyces bikiniensis TaxID=1896 RepID=UPI0004BEEB30|nr:hypothetical protein [Streptomyces bikiniensis]
MPWDEWEHIKSEVAGREPTSMRLNQVAPEPGGGGYSEDLKTDKKAWAKAGEEVIGLKEGITTSLTKLDSGQAGLGDTGEIQSAAAQKELYDSWKKYVGDVSGRCDALGGLLQLAGHDLAKTDETVKQDLDALAVRYGDTEAVGGRAGER